VRRLGGAYHAVSRLVESKTDPRTA